MFKVDLSEVEHAGDEFDMSASRLSGNMQRIVQQTGAAHAKSNHKYTNRTYNLERSTDAYLTKSTPSETVVTLTATAPYAQPVANLGYLDMDESAHIAENALDYFFSSFTRD